MTQANPYDLEVRSCAHTDGTCGCPDPTHAFIEVTNRHTYNPDLIQMLDSLRWTASILGRLTLTLTEQIAQEQTNHSCHRDEPIYDGCAITCTGSPIWTNCAHIPGPDDTERQLTLSVSIPTHRHKHYLRHINKTLADLIKSDAWEPSHVTRQTWAYLDQPATPIQPTAADRREQYR